MLTIELSRWGATLFGRQHGAAVRQELLDLIAEQPEVVLDFSRVSRMSLSFADECFGLLVEELASRDAPPHVRFSGATRDARAALHFALRQRNEERLSA